MPYRDEVIERLAEQATWAYHPTGSPAIEPAALAALALLGHGLDSAARKPLDWLASLQSADGSTGVFPDQAAPGWTTGMAILAWQQASDQFPGRYARCIERGVQWTLTAAGKPLEQNEQMGHNATLIGWPWVEGTHSWIEPTSWSVLALKSTGYASHPRTREGVRLLADRLLPAGGCNYGNTFVLGQPLRPHVQPTGICLTALAGEADLDDRPRRALDYLQSELSTHTASASLSYGLIGLAAHGRFPAQREAWLTAASLRTLERDCAAHKLALLSLAELGNACPLLPRVAERSSR